MVRGWKTISLNGVWTSKSHDLLSAQDQKQVLRKHLKTKRCRLSLLPTVLKMNHDESPWGPGCTDIVATYFGHLVLWHGARQTYPLCASVSMCLVLSGYKITTAKIASNFLKWEGSPPTNHNWQRGSLNLARKRVYDSWWHGAIFTCCLFKLFLYLIWWVVSHLEYPISKDYFHQHSLSATGGCRDEARSRHASKVLTTVLKRMVQQSFTCAYAYMQMHRYRSEPSTASTSTKSIVPLPVLHIWGFFQHNPKETTPIGNKQHPNLWRNPSSWAYNEERLQTSLGCSEQEDGLSMVTELT